MTQTSTARGRRPAGASLTSHRVACGRCRPRGTNRVRLTTGKGDTSSPTWSPDGKRIAFSDLNKAGGKRYDIYVIDADGSDLRKLIGSSSNDLSPAWAPNGRQIMFERDRSLWTASPDGKNQRRLRAGTSPAWAYDGRRIAFDFRGDIWTANATGGGSREARGRHHEAPRAAWPGLQTGDGSHTPSQIEAISSGSTRTEAARTAHAPERAFPLPAFLAAEAVVRQIAAYFLRAAISV